MKSLHFSLCRLYSAISKNISFFQHTIFHVERGSGNSLELYRARSFYLCFYLCIFFSRLLVTIIFVTVSTEDILVAKLIESVLDDAKIMYRVLK